MHFNDALKEHLSKSQYTTDERTFMAQLILVNKLTGAPDVASPVRVSGVRLHKDDAFHSAYSTVLSEAPGVYYAFPPDEDCEAHREFPGAFFVSDVPIKGKQRVFLFAFSQPLNAERIQ